MKKRVTYAEQLLGLLLALPIVMSLFVVMGLLESFAELNHYFAAAHELIGIEKIGTDVFLTLSHFPITFIVFCLLHLYLGIALVQHCDGLDSSERVRVIWFGFYALEWIPSDHLTQPKPEQVAAGNVR